MRQFIIIEYGRLNMKSILKSPIKKMTERSDFHKYSIVNIQLSIPARPGKETLNREL